MTTYEAFSQLGIPVTKDVPAIKKAYQQLVPQHHPEVDPQGFMALHQAYKQALAYAQGTTQANGTAGMGFRQGETIQLFPAETRYDSLFAALEDEQAPYLAQYKDDFRRQLRRLDLHWLPISLKRWQTFFSGDAFLLCRGEKDCLEPLLNLLVKKVHTYPVFHFLFNRLWELDGLLMSEGKDALSRLTRACISTLSAQYRHYRGADTTIRSKRLLPAVWYYEALPYYFRMLVSIILIPVLALGNESAISTLLFIFYGVELVIALRKNHRKLGYFAPVEWGIMKFMHPTGVGDSGFLILVALYSFLLHIVGCHGLWELLAGS